MHILMNVCLRTRIHMYTYKTMHVTYIHMHTAGIYIQNAYRYYMDACIYAYKGQEHFEIAW